MSGSRHSYVRFWPSDWLAGTARLSRLLRSIYFDVCLHNWDHAVPLPKSALPMVFGDVQDWPAHIQTLVDMGKLKRTKGGGLYSERALIEARSSYERHSIARASGKAGADKRWKTKENKNSHPIRVVVTNQNQNQNHKEKEKKEPPTPLILPEWMPRETWDAFLAMRANIKKPATLFAQQKIITKLDNMRKRGLDAGRVLERSVINCWQDVYEPRANEEDSYRREPRLTL